MPISVKGRDTLPITLIVPSKNLGFLESEHTQSDLFSTCSRSITNDEAALTQLMVALAGYLF